MLKKLIPKKIRNKRLRESVAYSSSTSSISSGGGGSGGGGLPYTTDQEGNYVIDNSMKIEGTIMAKGGIFDGDIVAQNTNSVIFTANDSGGGATNLNDLTDVVIENPREGDLLRFDGKQWRNISKIIINAGLYKT